MLLVGIAGGIAKSGVHLGDVLVSEQIVDYEQQKVTPAKAQIRWTVFPADRRLLLAAKNFADKAWTRLLKRPEVGLPELHFGPICTGDKVVAKKGLANQLIEVWPKLIGIEMEAGGVASAIFQADNAPGFLMIRGVSDMADAKKDSRGVRPWRQYACRAAAHYAVSFLKDGPVPATRESPSTGESVGGIVVFYPHRSELNQEWWKRFYGPEKRPKQVIMMGQSMARAFIDPFSKVFREWCNSGTKMQILFLSPDCTVSNQLLDVSRQISFSTQSVLKLKSKIDDAIENLNNNLLACVTNPASKPLVRFATRDLPFSLMAVDGDMVVTFYGTEAEADLSPTLVIRGEKTQAYQAFLSEFQNIWRQHSKVYPYQDPMLGYMRKDWQDLARLHEYSALEPPRQAILYPTYGCSANCSYCMYSSRHGNPSEMSVESFRQKLFELLTAGVRHIELSGGGEPTQHRAFGLLLPIIQECAANKPQAQFGLLSNGMLLHRFDAAELVKTFNEYIRVSRCEMSLRDGAKWRDSVKSLLDAKTDTEANTKVSVKYLLTKGTREQVLETIREDFADEEFRRADYFRFRSSRDYPEEEVANDEEEIWRILRSCQHLDCEHCVSLALGQTRYSRNFQCWISPMSVVIDPQFDAYLCCNYVHDEAAKKIGNISARPFLDVWRDAQHCRKRQALNRTHCDRPIYANCRFAELQDHVERLMLMTGMAH